MRNFRRCFRDNFGPESDSIAISGGNVGQVGLYDWVKCGGSRSNRSRDMQLPHFVTNDNDDNNAGVRKTILIVIIATVTMETPHVTKKVPLGSNISKSRQHAGGVE